MFHCWKQNHGPLVETPKWVVGGAGLWALVALERWANYAAKLSEFNFAAMVLDTFATPTDKIWVGADELKT